MVGNRKLSYVHHAVALRPFETVLLLPRYVMPTMISIEFFFFSRDQWVPQVEVRPFVCIYILVRTLGFLFSRFVK